jgi:hypothetical protein
LQAIFHLVQVAQLSFNVIGLLQPSPLLVQLQRRHGIIDSENLVSSECAFLEKKLQLSPGSWRAHG